MNNDELTTSEIHELALAYAQAKIILYMKETPGYKSDDALNMLVHSYEYAIRQIPNEKIREVTYFKY